MIQLNFPVIDDKVELKLELLEHDLGNHYLKFGDPWLQNRFIK
jgi:hypothetical protein